MSVSLAVRAMNHARKEHVPTYVGLRLLFAGMNKSTVNEWSEQHARNRLATGREMQYQRYLTFKGETDGTKTYRTCFAPSPSTLVTESYVLALLSGERTFALPQCVYSYRWPRPQSGHNYDFFMRGYRERQSGIHGAVTGQANPHSVFVTDIKGFYPSCSKEQLLSKLERRISQSLIPSNIGKGIRDVTEQLLSIEGCKGIPIGTALGHLLGHIALEDVDTELQSSFGVNYFRYVDDIAVVAPSADTAQVKRKVQEAIERAGFELNQDKTETVPGNIWQSSIHKDSEDTFSKLRWDIIFFLKRKPEDFEQLQAALRNEGFLLPLELFRSEVKYSRLWMYLRKIFGSIGRTSRSLTIQEILETAHRVRKNIRHVLSDLVRDPYPIFTRTEQKWELQRYKWCLNRLLYLGPSSDFPAMLSILPHYSELNPYAALLQGLIDKNVDGLLPFCGPTVSAFSQLWRELHPGEKVSLTAEFAQHRVAIESTGVMALSALVTQERLSSLAVDGRHEELFLKFCGEAIPRSRELTDLSYVDELRSLQIGSEKGFAEAALRTKFDDLEFEYLDAFDLPGAGSY